MATASVRIPHADRFTTWFPDFLKKELSPFPGRGAIVARTVISATFTMILIVTFRIPGGFVGVLSAFLLSRDDLAATAKSAAQLVGAFLLGGLLAPLGACFFASEPLTHFLWEGVSVLISFFLLRTLTNYAVATGLTILSTNVLSIWYLPGPVEDNVERTLWQIGGSIIGVLVTFAVEAVFHALYPHNQVLEGIDSRLKEIQAQMQCYASGAGLSPEGGKRLAQFAIVGVGGIRRQLTRGNYEHLYRKRMNALLALAGRAIDFAAALSASMQSLPLDLRARAERLARHIADIRRCLETSGVPCEAPFELEPSPAAPLLSELESMVSLMPSIFTRDSALDPRLDLVEGPPTQNRVFVRDAFSNPEHLRFVLGGTLAAMTCYVLYVSLDWPGLSTAVTTCVLTALTNVGTSRQKQVLRLAGAVVGGFVFGLGAQVFVLPYIDSITGFSVLFAAVTAIAAWIATSSTRLSYAGVQMALAFYLIHLSEFSIQTSLTVARDRAIGVLLGTTMMWMVFERLYPNRAGDEMVRVFIRNLRLIAEISSAPGVEADADAILKIRRKREQIYENFGAVSAQADAVPFETGPMRAGDMAARDRIRRWQASLRTFYLLEVPLLQFRVLSTEREKSSDFAHVEDAFRKAIVQTMLHIANNLEGQLNGGRPTSDRDPALRTELDRLEKECEDRFSDRERALLGLAHTVAQLLDRFQDQVIEEPLFATN
jgi:multidrug resistance protein MdtO